MYKHFLDVAAVVRLRRYVGFDLKQINEKETCWRRLVIYGIVSLDLNYPFPALIHSRVQLVSFVEAT